MRDKGFFFDVSVTLGFDVRF